MNKFFYIVTYRNQEDMLCFEHCVIEAESVDEAYEKGMETFDDQVIELNKTRLENNYVIPVSEAGL